MGSRGTTVSTAGLIIGRFFMLRLYSIAVDLPQFIKIAVLDMSNTESFGRFDYLLICDRNVLSKFLVYGVYNPTPRNLMISNER